MATKLFCDRCDSIIKLADQEIVHVIWFGSKEKERIELCNDCLLSFYTWVQIPAQSIAMK